MEADKLLCVAAQRDADTEEPGQDELYGVGTVIKVLQVIRTPDEALKILGEHGSDIQWGADLGGDDETIITGLYDKPVFIEHYPKKVKAFYMKEHPEKPEYVKCADLLAPEGYGEIIGGSQREDDHGKLLQAILDNGLDPERYGWYLDLRKYGSVPHSGFGLGIERTLSWICGLKHVRETIPFPRMIYRAYP